jgi:ribonuclease HII
VAPHHVVIDGRRIRGLGLAHTAIVGGDARCYSIACASIVAKVTRDRVMKALAKRYPSYGWERNVGYSTASHLAGLAAAGVTPHHRRSFVPVYQLALELADAPTVGDPTAPMEPPSAVIDPGAALDLAADLIAPADVAHTSIAPPPT